VADAAAYYKAQGRTLYDALVRIWQEHGWFLEALHNVTLPGKEGQAQIAAMMESLRQNPPASFGGIPIAYTDDYATQTGVDHAAGSTYPLALGRANVLHYRFADGGFVMVRPSGTEPKLKLYFSVVGENLAGAQAKLDQVKADTLRRMGLA
jgi:phosphoglucomutase